MFQAHFIGDGVKNVDNMITCKQDTIIWFPDRISAGLEVGSWILLVLKKLNILVIDYYNEGEKFESY